MLDENEIIARYFTRQIQSETLVLGVGDDAAVSRSAIEEDLITSIDTLNEAIHFPADTAAADIGWKALAVSLSDMAAMGATPRHCLLSLTLPEASEVWCQQFAEGFWQLAKAHQVALIGGDTTRGPLAVTTVVQGALPRGQAILRSGAKPNDDIYVSGTLGDAALALQQRQQGERVATALQSRLNRPMPRVALGIALRGIASAAIDLSDGLSGDLKKLLAASQVGATIHWQQCPLSPFLQALENISLQQTLALASGDDYELCFTAAPTHREHISALSAQLQLPLSRIGSTCKGHELTFFDCQQQPLSLSRHGYTHFKENEK